MARRHACLRSEHRDVWEGALFGFGWAEIWDLLARGAEQLRPLQPYVLIGTFFSAIAALAKIWSMARNLSRDRRRVHIVALNIATGERKTIVALPASKITRAEVLGTMRLAAGGRTLDTSQTTLLSQDFYLIGSEVVVELPPADFEHIRG